VDFGIIKRHVRSLMETLDHKFLNELDYFQDGTPPSSENIARYVADGLADRLDIPGIRVSRVTAWESDDASATYLPA
jgi:6-pyruvoyltetrahydropterin/6-carboxytetrahydropterin synthase